MRPLSLIVCLCSVFCTTMTQEPTFEEPPSGSTTTFVYGETRTVTITMNCKVSNLQPGQKVSWLKGRDDTFISDNHTVRTEHVSHLVDNDRYNINGNETRGEYNLQITMVSYKTAVFDSGRYRCAVFYDDPTFLAALKRSNVVQQNIYVVPRIFYPQCLVNNAIATLVSDVIEGEAMTFSCQSDAGYPTVTMAWYHGNPAVILANIVSVHDDVASVEYVWIPTVNDASATFTCAINHPAFTTERSRTNCSVGPFNIHRRTTMEYYPTSTLQHVPKEMFTSMMSVGDNDHNNTNPTLTTMATVTILDDKTNLRLCSGERFSRSIIAGTFIGGLLLGMAITIISGLLCNYLRHSNVEKPGKQVSANTATGQANPTEMDETRGAQYEIIMQSKQDEHYQSLTDRSHNDVYTSLQKASQ